MPISNNALSVGSNPLALASNMGAGWVSVQALDGVLYVGGPSVASNTGLAINSNVTLSVPGGGSLYGISGGAAHVSVRVLELD